MSEEYEIEVIPVVVAAEPIELYKILKIENLVTSGSEAKNYIAEGYVYVNGEIETRKRKKIMFGDIIGFNGEAYQVLSAEDMQAYQDEMGESYNAEPESYAYDDTEATHHAFTEDADSYVAEPTEYAEEPVLHIEEPKVAAKKKKSKKKGNKKVEAEPAAKKKKGRAAPFNF